MVGIYLPLNQSIRALSISAEKETCFIILTESDPDTQTQVKADLSETNWF